MNTFDRHIIRRIAVGYGALILLLIAFFIVLHYVEYIDDFLQRDASQAEIFRIYYPNYIPEIVRLVSPLALFVSAVFLTARLSNELQTVALFSNSVSLYRFMVPYVVLGLMVTVAMIGFNGWIVPRTNETVLAFEKKYLNQTSEDVVNNNIYRQERPGTILNVGYFDRKTDTAYRVSLISVDSTGQLRRRSESKQMMWVDSLRTWRLISTVSYAFDEQGEAHRVSTIEEDTTLNILPRDLYRSSRDVERLTFSEAKDYVESLRRAGVAQLSRPLVDYYAKTAYPFANFVLMLIAVPLAVVRRRGGYAVQIGAALMVAFVYLSVQKVTEAFGYSGDIPPLATVWLPHIVFLIVGIVLLVRARK